MLVPVGLRTLDMDSLPVINLGLMRGSRPDSLFGDLLRLRNAYLVGVLRDPVEVPVDDVAGRAVDRLCGDNARVREGQ
jgi:hypothetical protein